MVKGPILRQHGTASIYGSNIKGVGSVWKQVKVFFKDFVYSGSPDVVCQVSTYYYVWVWLKSLWRWWVVLRTIIVLSLAKSEQLLWKCIHLFSTYVLFLLYENCLPSLARLSTGFVFLYFVQTEGYLWKFIFAPVWMTEHLFFCKKVAHWNYRNAACFSFYVALMVIAEFNN